ncbi:MAG TPA: cyclic nucleotide-binding domain-containing protein [Syntrophobacteria bacterium]|nr:cyclic nucleotide-binding domain-containing protein [Syntrophobacteria bacterium]
METLSLCHLFRGLSEAQVARLAAITREVPIGKGQCLGHEGEPAKEFFVLKDGAVEQITKVGGDFELPIAMLREAGSSFGASGLVAPYLYSLSARCAEDGTMLVIQLADLQKLMEEDRAIGCTIMTNWATHLLGRLKETRQQLKIHFKCLLTSMHP